MKYPIDKELRLIAKLKVPANIKLAAAMSKATKMFKCKTDEKVNVMEHYVGGHGGEKIKTYVIEPKTFEGELPCLVFYHGGGFVMGASGGHYNLAKEYAEKVPCKVIYPDYRLAPEFKYPIPAEDCYAVYEWALWNADSLGIDKERVYIGGDSAGGCLAAAVTLMARDRGLVMPHKEVLIYPVTDRTMITESMRNFTDTPVWDARLSKMMWEAYLGDREPEHPEYASPAEAYSLERFPQTYMEVAEFDSLHDEGLMFANRLKIAGISVEMHEIKGACHGYETAGSSRITRECMARRIQGLQGAGHNSNTDKPDEVNRLIEEFVKGL